MKVTIECENRYDRERALSHASRQTVPNEISLEEFVLVEP